MTNSFPPTALRRVPHPSAILLASAAALAAAGCSSGSADQDGLTLQDAVVERQTIESSVEATGTIEPVRRVEVKSQASGEILEMPVDLGDRVEQGELLARIDPRDEVNELEQARADLDQAEAQLQVAESRLERARALRDSGVVTATELESAILEHANAQSAHQQARTRLELATEQREDATVRAPITGTVIAKQVEAGQIITSTRDVTGGSTLMEMADLSEVQVRTLVDESEIGQIEPGMQVEIAVEAYTERTFTGQVLKVEPQATVEQNVTMFAVLSRIANEEGLLRPGMNADVSILVGRRSDVLALANSGVKLPEEARRLVDALGMDESLLEQDAPSVPGSDTAAADGGGGEDDASGDDGLPTAEELRNMSPDERRELFEELDAGERRRLMQRMREAREAAERGRDAGQPRKAFVFRRDAEGRLTLEPIMIGLSNFEHTEILAGLSEGDTVVQVPLALVQQSEMLNRIRERSGVPGMSN